MGCENDKLRDIRRIRGEIGGGSGYAGLGEKAGEGGKGKEKRSSLRSSGNLSDRKNGGSRKVTKIYFSKEKNKK